MDKSQTYKICLGEVMKKKKRKLVIDLTRVETEPKIKNLPTEKSPGPDGFNGEW